MVKEHFIFEKLEVPVKNRLCEELLNFWSNIFGSEYVSNQNLSSILSGNEKKFNRDLIFIVRTSESIISTVHLTISKFDKRIGGIGEVATLNCFRGKGFAKILCRMAIEEFEKNRGKWLFLATSNPVAARIYHSLGWRYIAGTKVMLRISNNHNNIETFFNNFLLRLKTSKVKIVRGSPELRLQLIPAVLIPSDQVVLDFNSGIFSVRWFVQRYCMGLYPKYEKLDGNGAWFVALSGKFIAGLVSVRFYDDFAQVDGFCVPGVSEKVLNKLYQSAISFAQKNNFSNIHMIADKLDKKKNEFLLKIGCLPTEERVRVESKDGILDMIVYSFPKFQPRRRARNLHRHGGANVKEN